MALLLPRLYAIMDPARVSDLSPAAAAEVLLAAGVKLIQYRNKRGSARDLYEASLRIAAQARKAGAMSIVNDRADVALTAGADGVHVGQEDLAAELARKVLGPRKLVGRSTHRLEQVAEADRSSADYVAFGPIFPTASKQDPDPVVGLAGLRQARKATRKPLVAIGGITVENARSAIEAGADSVAVIQGLLGARDLATRAREFFSVLED